MSSGPTQIANLALNHVGEPPITDLNDDDNATANIVLVVYEPAIREMGRDHEWNCLKRRQDLPIVLPAPLFGFKFQYELPVELIRLLRLNGRDIRENTSLFEIEGRHLLTHADTAKIQYIAFDPDTTVYDTMFREALAVLIASKIAIQLRQDEALAARLFQTYKTVHLPAARKVDGNERNVAPYDPREQSRWRDSRVVGTRQGGINDNM